VEGTRSYWLDLFTSKTWQEFLEAGAKVSGFRERRWRIIQRIKLGDYLLCYLTGVSRFIGVLEVTSKLFRDTTPIWPEAARADRRVRLAGHLPADRAAALPGRRAWTQGVGDGS
jgi:predicted RNA-binding protein